MRLHADKTTSIIGAAILHTLRECLCFDLYSLVTTVTLAQHLAESVFNGTISDCAS